VKIQVYTMMHGQKTIKNLFTLCMRLCYIYIRDNFRFFFAGGGKQWQTTPKNLPRMQRTRAIPVAWLGSGLCPDRPKGWIHIIIITIIIIINKGYYTSISYMRHLYALTQRWRAERKASALWHNYYPTWHLNTETDYDNSRGHNLNTLTQHFCSEELYHILKISQLFVTSVWYLIFDGYAYCFPLSQDYWGSWRHSTLLESKPNWAGSPTGIFIPLRLFDVNETHCLREALRNTEFTSAKLILSIALESRNRIFHSPSVLVEQIPCARCHQCQTFATFSVVVPVEGHPERSSSSTDIRPFLKPLNQS
jgi:hypothetical protein